MLLQYHQIALGERVAGEDDVYELSAECTIVILDLLQYSVHMCKLLYLTCTCMHMRTDCNMDFTKICGYDRSG